MDANPYQELLGKDWEGLCDSARAAHSFPLKALGKVDVRWPGGWLHHTVAALSRMPPPGLDQCVTLELVPERGRIVWLRRFGEFHVRTLQWRDKDTLVEQVGVFRLLFKLVRRGEELSYEQVGVRALGLPLPVWSGIRVAATVSSSPVGWRVLVVVRAPILGEICRYGGELWTA